MIYSLIDSTKMIFFNWYWVVCRFGRLAVTGITMVMVEVIHFTFLHEAARKTTGTGVICLIDTNITRERSLSSRKLDLISACHVFYPYRQTATNLSGFFKSFWWEELTKWGHYTKAGFAAETPVTQLCNLMRVAAELVRSKHIPVMPKQALLTAAHFSCALKFSYVHTNPQITPPPPP